MPYTSIKHMGTWSEKAGEYVGRTFVGKREDALCITFRKGMEPQVICLSASDPFREALEDRVHG